MSDTGDVVVFLSSELIAEVMERYFRKELFKKPVMIVDLKGAENGYSFTLAFRVPAGVSQHESSEASLPSDTPHVYLQKAMHKELERFNTLGAYQRGQNGRFMKRMKLPEEEPVSE